MGDERGACFDIGLDAGAARVGVAEADAVTGGDEALLRRSLRRLLDEFGPLQREPVPAEPEPSARAALAARMLKL